MKPFEREYSTPEAQGRLEALCRHLGFTVEVVMDCPTVAHVALRDTSGNLLTEGSGKGDCPLVGALAEAIEHHHFEQIPPSAQAVRCDAIAEQTSASHDVVLRALSRYPGTMECAACTTGRATAHW